MPVPSAPPAWWGSFLWLVGVALSAFTVAWLSGTRLRIRRTLYIPLLFVVTGLLAAGYIAWLGVGFGDVLRARWGWGILAGFLTAAVLAVPAAHQPVDHPVHGQERVRAVAWEGIVYGVAEGVLLSALPAFITWQLVESLDWTGAPGGIARWTLPLVASAVVVVVHHLGYWNYRGRILVPITLGLAVQSTAFLVTASWVAPAFAHVLLHNELIFRGSEMPPVERPTRRLRSTSAARPHAA